jgi:Domain of unknown function (DUF4440)
MIRILFGLFIFLSFSCTKSRLEGQVLQVIRLESENFYSNSDRTKFLDYWADSKDMKFCYSGIDQSQNFHSKNELIQSVKKGLVPAANMAKFEMSNIAVKASGNVAWAMFDQKETTPEGKITYLHEFRLLVKENNEWKIIGNSVHSYFP